MSYHHDNTEEYEMEMCGQDTEEIVKLAFWLAFQASHPMGLGFLQSEAAAVATEDDVWDKVSKQESSDGSLRFSADYIYGRMMKMNLCIRDGEITFPSHKISPDYESWCLKYATYEDLLKAAQQDQF